MCGREGGSETNGRWLYFRTFIKLSRATCYIKWKLPNWNSDPYLNVAYMVYIWLLTRLHHLILPVSHSQMTGSFPFASPLSFYFMLIRYIYIACVLLICVCITTFPFFNVAHTCTIFISFWIGRLEWWAQITAYNSTAFCILCTPCLRALYTKCVQWLKPSMERICELTQLRVAYSYEHFENVPHNIQWHIAWWTIIY